MCYLLASGSNARGQLSNGTDDDSHTFQRCTFAGVGGQWPHGSKILSVAAGANHTLVLLRDPDGISQLWGCGDNRRGQIGPNFPVNSTSFSRIGLDCIESRFGVGVIKAIEVAWETSFIVISFDGEDRLFSAGGNEFGDLGVGITHKEMASWQLVRFGQLLPKDASDIRVLGLHAGPHTIIVKLQYVSDGSQGHLVAGWGASRHGQLGRLGASASQKLPNFFPSPTVIAVQKDVDSVAIGNQHSAFRISDGTVLSLGSNRKGQLGGLETARSIRIVQATWNGTYVVQGQTNDDNTWSVLKAEGKGIPVEPNSSTASILAGNMREVPFPPNVKSAKLLMLVCGSEHTLVHLMSGDKSGVYGWGWNEHGNLGLGHTDDVIDPVLIWPRERPLEGRIGGVWAGCATSWIAIEDDS